MPALDATTANVSYSSSSPARPLASAGSNLQTPVIITYLPLAEGADGTFQSLDAMGAAVRGEIPPDYSGYQDESNRQAAEQIISGVKGQRARGEIGALFDYVCHTVVYRDHPWNQQRVQDCARTLELGSGDCVSKSVCLATLLFALGYDARFVAQCPDDQGYTHVYVEAFDDDAQQWIALDCVAEDKPMGWSQPLPDGGFETTWLIFQ